MEPGVIGSSYLPGMRTQGGRSVQRSKRRFAQMFVLAGASKHFTHQVDDRLRAMSLSTFQYQEKLQNPGNLLLCPSSQRMGIPHFRLLMLETAAPPLFNSITCFNASAA